jgi:hypothetical protein
MPLTNPVGSEDQQQHPTVEVANVEGVGEQAQHQAENDDTGRSQPGEFTRPINGSNAEYVQRDGPTVEQVFVIPSNKSPCESSSQENSEHSECHGVFSAIEAGFDGTRRLERVKSMHHA